MNRPLLFVEDDRNFTTVLKLALTKSDATFPVRFVRDGAEAVDYLRGEGEFANRTTHPFPRVVVMDIKLPLLSGFEVLQWVRGQTDFDCLPVVMLSSSSDPRDIRKAYELRANSFLVKPLDFQSLTELIQELNVIWVRMNICPKVGRN